LPDSSPVKRTPKGRARAKAVIGFIAQLTIPSGTGQGKPFKLEPFQKDFIRDIYEPHLGDRRAVRRAILSMARKNGKGLALATPIATPRGFVAIAQLQIGDQVFDECGQPCRVSYVSPVHIGLRCWRLRFADGSEIVADEDHQWMTRHDHQVGVVTTPEIAASLQRTRGDGVVEHNHKLPVAGALRLAPVHLLIPPYVLGIGSATGPAPARSASAGMTPTQFAARSSKSSLSGSRRARLRPALRRVMGFRAVAVVAEPRQFRRNFARSATSIFRRPTNGPRATNALPCCKA